MWRQGGRLRSGCGSVLVVRAAFRAAAAVADVAAIIRGRSQAPRQPRVAADALVSLADLQSPQGALSSLHAKRAAAQCFCCRLHPSIKCTRSGLEVYGQLKPALSLPDVAEQGLCPGHSGTSGKAAATVSGNRPYTSQCSSQCQQVPGE